MVRKYHKPLSITKTEEEWMVIEKNASKNGVSALLQREITKIKNRFDECPSCPEFKKIIHDKKIKKRPYVAINIYQLIEPIARKMNVHPSEAVDILIIKPLLSQPASK